jgi:hypothetical protein
MRATRLLVMLATLASVAQAQVKLIAMGKLSGTYQDLNQETESPLENGVPGNRLGGMGSGFAYAGGDTFLALPDRGPNAKPYNTLTDDTSSYIPRFHTLSLRLQPADAGSALPFVLTPDMKATTLLWSHQPLVYGSGIGLGVASGAPALNRHHRFYFSGRSDNFDPAAPSTYPMNGRLDPEGIRVSHDGRRVFISDEYGPAVYEFDRFTGRRLRAFALPAKFAVSKKAPVGSDEIAGNTSGRVANKGMEGLAITPDGSALIGAMQSPLIQDGGTNGATTRLIRIDLHTGAIQEFAYPLTNLGSATKPKYTTVSEILAINDHELLVDERDGKGLGDGSAAAFKRLYRIDLSGAPEVSGVEGVSNLASKAVSKSLFLDVVQLLTAQGMRAEDIPAKIEGIAFGPDVTVDGVVKHTLFVANDNDYVSTVADALHPAAQDNNPNVWFVFAFGDSDLPGLMPQRFEGHSGCGDHQN